MSDQISSIVNYLGLDWGSKVIGVARINNLAKIAEPLSPIRVSETEDVFLAISNICLDNDVVGIVVGLPRNLEGQDTEQTKEVRNFADNLKQNLNLVVYMADEAGTTIEAKQIIGSSLVSLDSQAAALILENFISHKDINSMELV